MIADGDPERKGRCRLTATIKFPLCMIVSSVEVLMECRGLCGCLVLLYLLSWPCRSAGFRFCGGPQATGHQTTDTHDTYTHTLGTTPQVRLAGGNTDDDGLQLPGDPCNGHMPCGAWSFSGCGSRCHLVTTRRAQQQRYQRDVVSPQWRIAGGAGHWKVYVPVTFAC